MAFPSSRIHVPDTPIATCARATGRSHVASAFKHVTWMQFETLGFCFVLLRIARPKQCLPEVAVELFDDLNRVRSRVTRAAFQFV